MVVSWYHYCIICFFKRNRLSGFGDESIERFKVFNALPYIVLGLQKEVYMFEINVKAKKIYIEGCYRG